VKTIFKLVVLVFVALLFTPSWVIREYLPNHPTILLFQTQLKTQTYAAVRQVFDKLAGKLPGTINYLADIINDPAKKVPKNYYDVHPYGIYPSHAERDLCRFLDSFTLPHGYEEETFDCSESAAMLEWALETAGFHAYIAVGLCPWDPKLGNHAWVLVDTDEGKRLPIEATVFTKKAGFFESLWRGLRGRGRGVVYPGYPGYENYCHGYEHLFADIYEAVRWPGPSGRALGVSGYEQFNWWEGAWGFK